MYCPINTFFPAVTGTETSLTYDLYIKQVLKTKTPVYHEHFLPVNTVHFSNQFNYILVSYINYSGNWIDCTNIIQ